MKSLRDLGPENMQLAASKKISGVEVTDFVQRIQEDNNIYVLKTTWLGDPTKLILRTYFQLWDYQCLMERQIKRTPDLKEVLPPLPVVEDIDHMSAVEQYLKSLVLMVRNGSTLSAVIKNLFLPWSSDEEFKKEYFEKSSKSHAMSDREIVGLKNWYQVMGNFSSDDTQLLNVYEGDLVQNLGSVQQGWCFCKREQELGKLPGAILTPCSLTAKQIQTELTRLQEIRDTKPILNIPSTVDVTGFEPECDYVEMNPLDLSTNESKQPSPTIPPPFKPRPDIVKFPPSKPLPTFPKSQPVSPTQTCRDARPPLTQSGESKALPAEPPRNIRTELAGTDRKQTSADRYVVPELEATIPDDKKSPNKQPPSTARKIKVGKRRSKSMHFPSQVSPIQDGEPTTPTPRSRVTKIEYYAKSAVSTWEEVKKATHLQDQINSLTCPVHKDTARPGCALCTRSQWIAKDVCDEEIYRCVESHEPSLPVQLCTKQGDLVRVVNKHSNGWWDVCTLDQAKKEFKTLPATKLEREPQHPSILPKGLARQLRRNTSLDDLEHDYYDLTYGVKNKISAQPAIASVPIETRPSPVPYLTPIPNVSPPPPLPPKTDKVLSENEMFRYKTSPKNIQFRDVLIENPEKHKSKTLSPVQANDKFSIFTTSQNIPLSDSNTYTKAKKKSTSDYSDKPCMMSRISKLATLSTDNAKSKLIRGNSFVSYIAAEEEKENVFAPKLDTPRLDRTNSGGLKKTLSRELTWTSLGKQEGFFGSLSKERAEDMLRQNKINGEYLIRSSTTQEDSIVICVYHERSVHRYLCKFSNGKFVTGDPPMEFADIAGIVNYYKENALEFGISKGDIFLKQPLLMKRKLK